MQPQKREQRKTKKKAGPGNIRCNPKKENNASQEKKKGGTLKYTGKGEHRNALGKREQLKKKTKKKGGRPSQPWAKGQTQGTRTEDKAKGSTIIHWEGGTYLCTGKKKTSN